MKGLNRTSKYYQNIFNRIFLSGVLKCFLLFTILLLFKVDGYSQLLRDEEVDQSTVEAWVSENINGYSGIYIFAPNDGNHLILLISDSLICAQIHFPHFWQEAGYALENDLVDSSKIDFYSEYINLNGVRILGDKFISDEYQGEFVSFKSDTNYKGVKIYDSWNNLGNYSYEIGVKTEFKNDEYFKGQYSEASYKLLDSTYLSTFSNEELKLMRNEIYARYNYKFKSGSEMQQIFENVDWYSNSSARYTDVSNQLSKIELINIELIKKIEGR